MDKMKEYSITGGALVVICIILSIANPNFFSMSNLLDITRVVSINGIMALGMTLVILTGGIDLSVGSIFALAGAVTSSLVANSYSDYPLANMLKVPLPAAIIVGLCIAVLLGYVNGFIITKSKVEPFIVTLGAMNFVRGLTYLYTGGYPINFRPMPAGFAWIGQGNVLGIPTPTIFFVILAVVFWYILKYTGLGRAVYSIGGSHEAARLSGVNVRKNKIYVYMLLGLLSGISGIIMASRVASASPVAGVGYELDVIAAVVIGGTSLNGGKGSILGTIIGLFIMGVITNGLNMLAVPTYYQYIIKGLILLVAVGADSYIRRRKV